MRDAEVLVPDIAGWRRARMPERPDDQRFLIVPDRVCEVLSLSTASKDCEVKLPVYAQYGVAHAWIVDPDRQVVEVFARQGAAWSSIATFTGDARIIAPPFEEVALPPPWS